MEYPLYVLTALRNFSNQEKNQTNIDILAFYELIETGGRRVYTSEAGLVIGWKISEKGKDLLKVLE